MSRRPVCAIQALANDAADYETKEVEGTGGHYTRLFWSPYPLGVGYVLQCLRSGKTCYVLANAS
jgi:hypothetical protein